MHNKELLAIVDAFKHWRRYCEEAVHQVQVFSDHQNLEYFTTTKVLNRRQARWAQELAGIDFQIDYRPGSRNGKPDTLSRRSEYRPEKGGSENQPITTVYEKITSRNQTDKQEHSSLHRHGCPRSLLGTGWTDSRPKSRKKGKRMKNTRRNGSWWKRHRR